MMKLKQYYDDIWRYGPKGLDYLFVVLELVGKFAVAASEWLHSLRIVQLLDSCFLNNAAC